MCYNNTVCELFLNHEERLKHFERQLISLNAITNQIQIRLNQLQEQVSSIVIPADGVKNSLISRIGTTVTIQTDIGSVLGVLITVGEDYIEINELSGELIFIFLTSIVAL